MSAGCGGSGNAMEFDRDGEWLLPGRNFASPDRGRISEQVERSARPDCFVSIWTELADLFSGLHGEEGWNPVLPLSLHPETHLGGGKGRFIDPDLRGMLLREQNFDDIEAEDQFGMIEFPEPGIRAS